MHHKEHHCESIEFEFSFFLSFHFHVTHHHHQYMDNGQQQTFATSNLPINKLDFSHNAIRRLADKAFIGIQVRMLKRKKKKKTINNEKGKKIISFN